MDDIKTEYHPNSGRPTTVKAFSEFGKQQEAKPKLPCDPEPWRPFKSRSDFEFSELVLDAALNKKQTNRLIQLINRCMKGDDDFTIRNHEEMKQIFKNKNEEEYDFWCHPLWDWALDLIQDCHLAPFFEWDAQKLFKFNGERFIQYFHEPWTGNRFWDAQSSIPKTGKPFGFILYADKTKLSSFGTEMGYPVKDDEAHKGKAGYVDFKRIIWHESFRILMETIQEYSKTGAWVNCGDGETRQLYPFIFILSADYEEQCVMALICGFQGLCPCPICYIPDKELTNVGEGYKLCTAEDSQMKYEEASQSTPTVHEEIMKEAGLQFVKNAFWEIHFSDPHKALSWDRMHSYPHGLGGKHLFPELQSFLSESHIKAKKADDQISSLPRWRGLNHFSSLTSITFSDANKYEDILKMSIFVTHNLISANTSPNGYLLLKCLQSYLNLDMYAALEVHTEITLKDAQQELHRFMRLINKNWSFPKMHTHWHAFLGDIIQKGVTANMSTKPNEKCHGPLKLAYLLMTNFKHVGPQILKIDHWKLVAAFIRDNINELDGLDKDKDGDGDPENELDICTSVFDGTYGQIKLGAEQKKITFQKLETLKSNEIAFNHFRIRFTTFLGEYCQSNNISLPGNKYPSLAPMEYITEYQFLKVSFESFVDWRTATDYLWCNPQFHGRPCYDCVILNKDPEPAVFGRLLLVFTFKIGNESHPFALIHPYKPAGMLCRKDKDLGLIRVRAQPQAQSQFFAARSIIRGAFIIPEFSKPDEYHIVDVVDTDMFLRLQSMYPHLKQL
ncbi:hypothetical protein BDQ12DRAFT_698231 [Crucibulum laeve]|uniref:Uncharacterized protein n=1 Tax=Crucibulum laeve TaxID=68775 RepID=A0A5C3MD67_9AGAR|nr:hypothetical protein BDQ12DRAFT_698231 [Crucibulum laeve]